MQALFSLRRARLGPHPFKEHEYHSYHHPLKALNRQRYASYSTANDKRVDVARFFGLTETFISDVVNLAEETDDGLCAQKDILYSGTMDKKGE